MLFRSPQAIENALALAVSIARAAPATAPALFDGLRQPFVVRALESPRLTTAADLSRRIDFAASCREPVSQLEPHVPWDDFFLPLRRDCYRAAGDPRLAIAERELADFYAHEPAPLR